VNNSEILLELLPKVTVHSKYISSCSQENWKLYDNVFLLTSHCSIELTVEWVGFVIGVVVALLAFSPQPILRAALCIVLLLAIVVAPANYFFALTSVKFELIDFIVINIYVISQSALSASFVFLTRSIFFRCKNQLANIKGRK
tara:strand:+ start:2163 stop:2591 length:429 start_codon:yes stop_codon:yes gene_type:complete